MKSINKLVLATPALGLEDGGAASLSRLVARATHNYCQQNGLDFEILDLGSPTDSLPGFSITHFSSNQKAMALALWNRALRPPQTAFIFMHVGLARPFALLPGFIQPPHIVWLLGVEVWRPFNWQQRKAMHNATLRLAISAYTRDRTKQTHPWLPATQVLHLALEERPISGELDNDLLNRAGDNFVLIVGRLDASQRHKGHDDLIEAMPPVIRAVPEAKLVIVGKGDDMSRLQALALSLAVENKVMFTGFVSEKTRDELYKRCRVFAMPSRNDGFGLVYLEAMKAGKPCIVLENASGAEIVQDGKTGLLVEQNNPEQLQKALLRCLTDDGLCQKFGRSGYKHWQNAFSFQSFQAQFHAYLQTITHGGHI